MLPEGWKEERLDELLKNKTITVHIDGNHGSFYPKKEEFVSSGVPYISANCIQNGRIDFQKCKFLAPEKADKLQKGIAKDGDVLFAHNATVGPVALLKTSEERVILSTTLTLYRCDPIKLNNSFLYQYMSSTYFDTQYESIMRQTTRNQVPITAQREFVFLLPPLPEQKKIAAILSTWDRAIEGTEKLLANSQQQKKALMQQLLTGKKRLPGFTGEWLRYKLGEIADFLKGKGLSKADINPKGKTPCIHYGSLFTEQPSTITETKTLTNTFKGAVFSKKNDVLMPTSDVTPAGLAVASAIQKNNVLLGNDILIIRPNYERLYGPFLSRVIRNSKKNILSFATGTTVFHLYASDMKGFLLLVPPLPEQKAIAAVLTTADEEITALEADLARLRQEKKALMQQLLTGKRRVTVD